MGLEAWIVDTSQKILIPEIIKLPGEVNGNLEVLEV
jgi:hypothetical protein